MGVPPWMVLVVLLSAGTSLSAVSVNWLTDVVKTIITEYDIKSQICLAASIQINLGQHELNQILKRNPYRRAGSNTLQEGDVHYNSGAVSDVLERNKVYISNDIIVAKPTEGGPIHAERRVLTNLNRLKIPKNNFLLIYSFLSPCSKCTGSGKYNIVDLIKKNKIKSDSAFVFRTVFDRPIYGPVVPRKELEVSLKKLGDAMGGLKKVYRCYKPTKEELECHSCSEQGQIAEFCVNNNAVPGQSVSSTRYRNRSRDSSRHRNRSRDSSRHRNRSRDSPRPGNLQRSSSDSSLSNNRQQWKDSGKIHKRNRNRKGRRP